MLDDLYYIGQALLRKIWLIELHCMNIHTWDGSNKWLHRTCNLFGISSYGMQSCMRYLLLGVHNLLCSLHCAMYINRRKHATDSQKWPHLPGFVTSYSITVITHEKSYGGIVTHLGNPAEMLFWCPLRLVDICFLVVVTESWLRNNLQRELINEYCHPHHWTTFFK